MPSRSIACPTQSAKKQRCFILGWYRVWPEVHQRLRLEAANPPTFSSRSGWLFRTLPLHCRLLKIYVTFETQRGHLQLHSDMADSTDAWTMLRRWSARNLRASVYIVASTGWLFAITKQGLSKMTRNHVHFAVGTPGESHVISGMRST